MHPRALEKSPQRNGPKSPGAIGCGLPRPRVRRGGQACTKEPDLVAWEARRSLALHSPANMSKRGLFARLYAPNQTLIRVKTRLPKGILDGGNGGPARVWKQLTSRDFGLETANRPPAVSQAGVHAVRRLGALCLMAKGSD